MRRNQASLGEPSLPTPFKMSQKHAFVRSVAGHRKKRGRTYGGESARVSFSGHALGHPFTPK